MFQKWILILPVLVAMLMFYSCEDKPVSLEKDQITKQENNDLTEMTEADKLKYFGVSDLSTLSSGYTYTFTDTLNAEELEQFRRKISLRSSQPCEINVELHVSGPADTVEVTGKVANSSIFLYGPTLLVDGDDFDMTVNSAYDYDFIVEPIDNPTSSTNGYLEVDPEWGGETLYFFSGAGAKTFEDYHFECPPESPDGTCDAYVSVDKFSGAASTYNLEVDPDVETTFYVNPIDDNPNDEEDFEIDEDLTYDFGIKANLGGTSESFSVTIIRPDGIAHYKSFYGLDMSGGGYFEDVFDNFDYFECPY